jgi:hypothetical protein
MRRALAFLRWPLQVYALGFAALLLLNFEYLFLIKRGLLGLIVLAGLPLFALLGFAIFPLVLASFLYATYILAFQFEDRICRTDGDFWDTWLSHQLAFAGGIYACVALWGHYRLRLQGQKVGALVTWFVSLVIATALILLVDNILPSSMADCFK